MWLTFASFSTSIVALQGIDTVLAQATWILVILAVAITISVATKWKSNWRRTSPGWKGVLYAISILAFFSYALCKLSILNASQLGTELSGTFWSQASEALSDPKIFAIAMPFLFLPLFGAASHLGFSDLSGCDNVGSESR